MWYWKGLCLQLRHHDISPKSTTFWRSCQDRGREWAKGGSCCPAGWGLGHRSGPTKRSVCSGSTSGPFPGLAQVRAETISLGQSACSAGTAGRMWAWKREPEAIKMKSFFPPLASCHLPVHISWANCTLTSVQRTNLSLDSLCVLWTAVARLSSLFTHSAINGGFSNGGHCIYISLPFLDTMLALRLNNSMLKASGPWDFFFYRIVSNSAFLQLFEWKRW